jgi:two-component system chemotaxis response regulator CheY
MKTCLTVDDSKVVRKVIAKMLGELKIQTIEAENGKQALEECEKSLPDFILMDWNMPIMSGLEFLKIFRSNKDNDQVKVIFCTTVNELEKIKEVVASGGDEYIMKPFDAQVLKDKLIQTGIINEY